MSTTTTQQELSNLINELFDAFQDGDYKDTNDEYLIWQIARIVEATGGTMPYEVCTVCGSQDDGHYNNNAECEGTGL